MTLMVWMLRHGEAVAHDSRASDSDRELTPRGERQADDAGAALSRLGVELSACYASPRIRARDTADRACRSLNVEPQTLEALSEGFDVGDLGELLLAHESGDEVLLVGHEPDFSQLLHDLTGARVAMLKGGLASVEVETRAGRLITLLRPRELEALAAA